LIGSTILIFQGSAQERRWSCWPVVRKTLTGDWDFGEFTGNRKKEKGVDGRVFLANGFPSIGASNVRNGGIPFRKNSCPVRGDGFLLFVNNYCESRMR
jgi:hypothetical protein